MEKNGGRRFLRPDEKLWLKINEQIEYVPFILFGSKQTNGGTNTKSQKMERTKTKIEFIFHPIILAASRVSKKHTIFCYFFPWKI